MNKKVFLQHKQAEVRNLHAKITPSNHISNQEQFLAMISAVSRTNLSSKPSTKDKAAIFNLVINFLLKRKSIQISHGSEIEQMGIDHYTETRIDWQVSKQNKHN